MAIRPLGLYVFSADDPTAVFKYPNHNWVYLTPEPIHPVSLARWPYPCHGWRRYVRGGQALFLDMLHAKLGRDDWTLQDHIGPNHAKYTHKADGRTVHIFYNQTVEEHSAAAAAAMQPASIITSSRGTVKAMLSLAPKAEHVDWDEEGYYMPVMEPETGLPKWAPEVGDEWEFVKHEWPSDDEDEEDEDDEDDEGEEGEEGDEDDDYRMYISAG
jgi:hypothetical protein